MRTPEEIDRAISLLEFSAECAVTVGDRAALEASLMMRTTLLWLVGNDAKEVKHMERLLHNLELTKGRLAVKKASKE